MLLHLPNGQWEKTRESLELPHAVPIGVCKWTQKPSHNERCDTVVDSTEKRKSFAAAAFDRIACLSGMRCSVCCRRADPGHSHLRPGLDSLRFSVHEKDGQGEDQRRDDDAGDEAVESGAVEFRQ